MTANCILHVGAGKCGSSSLQACLSANPFITADDGTRYEYVCLKEKSGIIRGAMCGKVAAKNAYGYAASVSARRFFSPDDKRLRDRIHKVVSEGVVPVFSFEGWINEANVFEEQRILETLGLAAKVIIFVRPQLTWINSAWWQWGAWTRMSFGTWLKNWKPKGLWASVASSWQRVPGVEAVKVYTIAGDVVTRFHKSLGATEAPSSFNRNFSLDGSMLRFLQQHGELRTGRRQSAMHLMLGRHLAEGSTSPPWVLKPRQVANLIRYYRADNENLLEMVDEQVRDEISSDPQWWDASAFAHKHAELPGQQPLTLAQADDVASRAIRAVFELDERIRGK